MGTLYVNGHEMSMDRHGNPDTSEFCDALFPENIYMATRAACLANETHITNITDFLKTIAVKLNLNLQEISSCLEWHETESRQSRRSKRKASKKRRRSSKKASQPSPVTYTRRSILPDDLFDDEFEEEEDQDEEDVFFVDEENDSQHQQQDGDPSNFISVEDRMRIIQTNTQALLALGAFYTEPPVHSKQTDDFSALIKNTALPFVEALKRLGPVEHMNNASTPTARPENSSERLLSVSQRIRELGKDPDTFNVSSIGKRALELYRQKYPGHSPPQRVSTNNRGHEYLLNVYTPTICRHTVDRAVQEAR